MAIIRASKTFEGSELKPRTNTYIKPDIRTVSFGKDEKDGVYLFILGAFKEDSNGNGVWYRPTKVRDNFGNGMIKEKFASQPGCPIDFFENRVRGFAPNMAKPTETQDDNGRKRLNYPAWGRPAWRVLYNAAYFGKFEKGVHVLDLPMSGGGSVIDEFSRGRQPDGSENPSLTDYEAAIPVHIKLDLGAQGQPWKIMINPSKTFVLPVELADTEYIYNLDEVINYPSKAVLIEKLKSLVPPDIFRKGLEGYDDGSYVPEISGPVVASPRATTPNYPPTPPVAEPDDVPFNHPPEMPAAPVIPKATKSVAPAVSIPKANKAPVADTAGTDDLPGNPVAAPSVSTAMAAARAALGKSPAPRG